MWQNEPEETKEIYYKLYLRKSVNLRNITSLVKMDDLNYLLKRSAISNPFVFVFPTRSFLLISLIYIN
uniref:MATA-HMG n=1 Tax=Rhizophagus irregularis TaxID=588596 RepID=A0A1B1EU55_9GLOM|nr:MATA-HMG [Rhizophagus irregularis]